MVSASANAWEGMSDAAPVLATVVVRIFDKTARRLREFRKQFTSDEDLMPLYAATSVTALTRPDGATNAPAKPMWAASRGNVILRRYMDST
mmetsp:Transcript_16765/g.35210  ORF Transcript_16765/g.35210 Transcript_16765/m.35210 type:complete len:91 (+) Transcript_16765:708-980(+)